MRVHRLIPRTEAEGPGVRFCIWVQGCAHGCEGCFAEALWDYDKGTEVSAQDVKRQIEAQAKQIRGVTFLGGEPFDQAAALAEIARFAHGAGLDVIAFTGYLYETLLTREDASRLLDDVDLLIDGPYIRALQDFSRPLVGSSNQRFIYLTDRFTPEEIRAYRNRFEIRVDPDGTVFLNGMGDLNRLRRKIDNYI